MEICKIRLQMQALKPVAERQTAVELVKHLGIKGLYRGTPATLMRDVPFSFILFPTYANVRGLLSDEDGNCGPATNMAAGCFSAAASAGLVTPLDVVKTRRQLTDPPFYRPVMLPQPNPSQSNPTIRCRLQVSGAQKKYGGSISKCFKMTWAEGGMSVMYAGVIPRMMVVGPLFGITFVAFEAQKKYMLG